MFPYKNSLLKKTILLLTLQLIGYAYVNGQSSNIKILDAKSKESIPFAHVCFEEINGLKKEYSVTDKDGLVKNTFTKPFVIAISYVGYKSYLDTLQPNRNYEIALTPQVFDLDQVVVTASFTPQKADKSIYNVKVIDSRKIELKAANNLADVLKDEVNFQVTYDPALGSGLKLKGLSGNNVKILIDGVPVIGRMGGNIDLSQLNLYNVDHVEVVEGPMSVVYGSNALAGAINIITKENLHSNFSTTINSYYENKGTYNIDGIVAFKKGNHNYSFAGGRKFFGGVYLDVDTNRSQNWKPKELYNADFYYTYNKENYKIKYQLSFMNERLLDKGDQLPYDYRKAFDSWFYSQRINNRVEYNQEIKNDYYVNATLSHSYYRREKETYYKDFIDNTSVQVNGSENDTTLSNAAAFKIFVGNQNDKKKLNFLTGVDLNYETAAGKRILNKYQDIGDYATFINLMYNITSELTIQPGIRFSYNTKYTSQPVPSINVKWSTSPYLNIRASYARGYRAPTIKELFISFKDINHDIQPNQNLTAEHGHNFSLSFNINTDKTNKLHFTNIEFSLFYNQISNIIYLSPTSSTSATTYKYINISHFNSLGGNINFKYSYYPNFDFGFGFGNTGIFASTLEYRSSLNRYKYTIDGNANASYNIPRIDIKVFANYRYSGLANSVKLGAEELVEYGTLDPFHTLDISFIKKVLSNKLTISFGVKNILNNTIVSSKGFSNGDAPHTGGDGSPVGYGRLFFTSLSYNFFK